MAKVQKKTAMYTDIRVHDSSGHRRGSFEITSGNIYYYRKNAQKVTKKYTWHNLIKLIERDIQEGA